MHKQFDPHVQFLRTIQKIGPQIPSFQKTNDRRVWVGTDEELQVLEDKQDKTTAEENLLGSVTCTICLDVRKQKEDLWILPCRHLFHKACILNWARTKNTCPECKVSFDFVHTVNDHTLLLEEDNKRSRDSGGGGEEPRQNPPLWSIIPPNGEISIVNIPYGTIEYGDGLLIDDADIARLRAMDEPSREEILLERFDRLQLWREYKELYEQEVRRSILSVYDRVRTNDNRYGIIVGMNQIHIGVSLDFGEGLKYFAYGPYLEDQIVGGALSRDGLSQVQKNDQDEYLASHLQRRE